MPQIRKLLSDSVKKCDELIDRELILETAQKHEAGDERERKLTTLIFFWSLVLSVEDKVYHGFYPAMTSVSQKLTGKPIKKQSISDQMKRRDWRWLKEIYERLLEEYWPRLDGIDKSFLEQFTDFRIADSTVIEVVRTLRRKFRATTKDKAALKIHALFSLKKLVALEVTVTKQTYGDVRFRFLDGTKNVLYVFDLGYWCYELFEEIISQGSFFVSRLKDGSDVVVEEFLCPGYSAFRKRITLKELIDCNSLGGTVFDVMVKLGDMKTRVRLVGLKYGGEWRFYVTNITDQKFPPGLIYAIYRFRWQIEIFFKELKSNISLRHITTRNENAIMLEIYATLIFYLLTRMLMSEVARKSVDLSVRKSLAMVKRRLTDVVVPMLLGKVKRFKAELGSLLKILMLQCRPG